MTNRGSGDWLGAVLADAKDAGWCVRAHCTTCACREFRRAFWAGAARQAGMASRFESVRHSRDILSGVSSSEREVIVRTLVAGLRELPAVWSESEALRTIIIDLDPPLIQHGVAMALDTELSGTSAGETLASVRVHNGTVRAERGRRLAYESPEAVKERKRVERDKRAIAHARRQSETRQRNVERMELLAALARLSPVQRLSRFATDPVLKLDCVSPELIPEQERDLIGLERAKAAALVTRIDRRRGAWGRLRRMLEHFIADEPG